MYTHNQLSSDIPVRGQAFTASNTTQSTWVFDLVCSILGMGIIVGGYIDGWAHGHGRVDESFFTPWHATLYGAFLLYSLALLGMWWQRRQSAPSWAAALPSGYRLAVLGLVGFAFGGVADLLWHEIIGIEKDFEAVTSPSHLLLMLSFGLLVTAPFRSAWLQSLQGWRQLTPALLSLTTLISLLTLVLTSFHPLANHFGSKYINTVGQVLGAVSIFLIIAIMLAPVLLAMSRWRLPAGAITLMWGVNLVAMYLIGIQPTDSIVLPLLMIAAAVLCDLLYVWRMRRSMSVMSAMSAISDSPTNTGYPKVDLISDHSTRNTIHLFAFVSPLLLMGAYFLGIYLSERLLWSVHMWTGTTVVAAVIGWELSYLLLPATPNVQRTDSITNQIGQGLGYDWLFMLLSTLFVGGLYLDGWAHNHGKVDQSFFTIWHAFFYSGFLITAAMLGATMVINRWRGTSWPSTLPVGYPLSLAGIFLFGAGGVSDLIWHILFGIEDGFEALMSPSHLMLGIGLMLVSTGALRAAWHRAGNQLTWHNGIPALLSLTCLISVFTFFMMFSHPLMSMIGIKFDSTFSTDVGHRVGVGSLMLIAGLTVAPVLLVMRRWRLPPGALLFVWGINVIAMAIVDHEGRISNILMVGMLAGVVVAEAVRLWQERAAISVRWFAFAAPVAMYSGYFVALLATTGSSWSAHLLGGAILMPGLVTWLLSFLIFPPSQIRTSIGDVSGTL